MSRTEPDPLLNAILKLTTRHMESAQIVGEARRHYAKQDPLLKQLRDAIAADVGGPSGGSLPHERMPLDRDALEKYLTLTERIRDWAHTWLGVRPPIDENPEITLTHAYQAYVAIERRGDIDELSKTIALKLTQNAVTMILGKLSPPTTMELDEDPCPVCGFIWFNKVTNRGDGGVDNRGRKRPGWHEVERAVALTISYKPDGYGGLTKSFASCGCCETVWSGTEGIRELAYTLEHPELLDHLTETAAQESIGA